MSHFEHDLYEAELPPPNGRSAGGTTSSATRASARRAPRPDELCDACTKTHINDDPAQYYDYALASLIKFQLHDHICTQAPEAGRARLRLLRQSRVGDFLRNILAPGPPATGAA